MKEPFSSWVSLNMLQAALGEGAAYPENTGYSHTHTHMRSHVSRGPACVHNAALDSEVKYMLRQHKMSSRKTFMEKKIKAVSDV